MQDPDRVGQGIRPSRVGPPEPKRVQHQLHGVGDLHGGVLHLERIQLGDTQQTEGADRLQVSLSGSDGARGISTGEILIQHVLGITGGAQPSPHLIRSQPGLEEALAQLRHQLRLILKRAARLFGCGEILTLGHLRNLSPEHGSSSRDYPEERGQSPRAMKQRIHTKHEGECRS
jgi:hypothetical protein